MTHTQWLLLLLALGLLVLAFPVLVPLRTPTALRVCAALAAVAGVVVAVLVIVDW